MLVLGMVLLVVFGVCVLRLKTATSSDWPNLLGTSRMSAKQWQSDIKD